MYQYGGYKTNLWKLKGIRTLFWMHFFAAVMIPSIPIGAGLNCPRFYF